MWVQSPNPLPHWPSTPRGLWYPCLLTVSIPKHYQMQALCSGLGSPHSPGIPVCPNHTRYKEDTGLEKTQVSLDRWPFSSGDKVCPRSIRELSRIHHLSEQEWEAVETWQPLSSSLHLISLHVKKELNGPPGKTSWTRVAGFSLDPDTHRTESLSPPMPSPSCSVPFWAIVPCDS